MSTVNHYQICGLRLDSTIQLPELRAHRASRGAAPADFELVPAQIARPAEEGPVVMVSECPDGTLWMKCTRTSTGYRFDFPAFAEFFVDAGGRRVASAARPGTAPETLRHLFLDQVMPLLLNLRGTESLHGSAVLVEDGVCAFVGRSGQGKSTLAAAFHKAAGLGR